MHVVYVTPSTFATRNAGAIRNLSVASALASAGHRITIVSADPHESPAVEWTRLPTGVRLVGRGPRGGARNPFRRVRRLVEGPVTGGLGLEEPPDHLLAYNPGPFVHARVRAHARRHEIPYTVDVTEWLSARDLPGGRGSPYSWWYEAFMRRLPRRIESALAISSAMAHHLASSGARVLVVPPLHDGASRPPRRGSSDRGRILISGGALTRGGKDAGAIHLLADALETNPQLARQISVEVIGNLHASDPELVRLSALTDVEMRGWLGGSDTEASLQRADWLLVIRDPSGRRAEMGFPSKVTEAAVAGTPVIANSFSDVASVLDDGELGIVMRGYSAQELAATLVEALGRAVDRDAVARAGRERYTPDRWSERIDRFLTEECR